MKNLDLNLKELSVDEVMLIEGGTLVNWNMFWSGCKVGLAVGGGASAIYYFS
jgi:hypothetical protein